MRLQVKGSRSKRELAAYLPSNYSVVYWSPNVAIVEGDDVAGWTADGYVIPRLQSGLMGAVKC